MRIERDEAGTCRICKKPAMYSEGIQVTDDMGGFLHDKCSEDAEGDDVDARIDEWKLSK